MILARNFIKGIQQKLGNKLLVEKLLKTLDYSLIQHGLSIESDQECSDDNIRFVESIFTLIEESVSLVFYSQRAILRLLMPDQISTQDLYEIFLKSWLIEPLQKQLLESEISQAQSEKVVSLIRMSFEETKEDQGESVN